MRRWILLIVMLAGIVFTFMPAAVAQAREGGKTYTFALWPAYGKNSKQLNDFIKLVVNIVFKRMNEKVKIVEMTKEEAYKAAVNSKVDLLFVWQTDYVDMVNAKKDIHPLIAATAIGHLNEYRCVVMLKKTKYTGVKGMKGMSFPMPSTLGEYYATRWFLKSKGVDMPLDKFFGKLVPVDSELMALKSVVEGKVDVAVVGVPTINFQNFANVSMVRKIGKHDFHELPWPTSPIVSVGGMAKEDLKKFVDVMAKMESYPEFKRLKPMMKTLKSQIFLVTQKDYAPMVKIFNQAKKDGWDKEYGGITGK